MEQSDPNPILDEGSPTSTGSVKAASTLCDAIGIPLTLDPPRDVYQRGWGPTASNAVLITSSWTLTIQDMHDKAVSLTFDLSEDDSPLVIGLDAKRHSITDNLSTPARLILNRPKDKGPRSLPCYFDNSDRLRQRLRALVVPSVPIISALAATAAWPNLRISTLAKRLHRLTHAPPGEIVALCKKGGILTPDLSKRIYELSEACEICARSGLPHASKKVSITHVSEAFNQEVQIDFTFPVVRGQKVTVLHFVDTGTSYSEAVLASSRDHSAMSRAFQLAWLDRHGAPKCVSGDDEFNRRPFRSFLDSHGATFRPRPARRHNKVGIVERKHGTLKRILEKLQFEQSSADITQLLSLATFLSNIFSGSRTMSAFELVRGYHPSILGVPPKHVSEELVSAYREQESVRALQRLLRARAPSTIPPSCLQPGTSVYFYYKSSKQNEADEWKTGQVTRLLPSYAEVKHSARGPPARVAFEDLRLRPKSELTDELMTGTVEEVLGHGGEESAIPDSGMSATGTGSNAHQDLPVNDQPSSSAALAATSADAPSDSVRRHTNGLTGAAADIGPYAPAHDVALDPVENIDLASSEQTELQRVYEIIGARQVTAAQLEFASPALLERAAKVEHEENWSSAYAEVDRREVPRDANVISSHWVYKIKKATNGTLRLKGRLVLHGNRDDEKDVIRKDSAAADMLIVRIVIAIGTLLGFSFASTDIKGAYMQSGPILRHIYVRPPSGLGFDRNTFWHLTKLPYGIVEAGRQWLRVVEDWMRTGAGLSQAFGVSQLFVQRGENGLVSLLVAKTVDDFLIAGQPQDIESFIKALSARFVVGNIEVGPRFTFNGCEIERDANGVVSVSMDEYRKRLKPLPLSRERRREREAKASDREEKEYRSLAGTLLYMGNAVLPQASLVASRMQQRIADLRVWHLSDANAMLKELLGLDIRLTYRPMRTVTFARIVCFSDASHGGSDSAFGQSGGVCGIVVQGSNEKGCYYYPLGWISQKQRRISHSAFGAEIIACADVDDRGYDLKETFRSVFPHCRIRHELFVDSRALFDTITTLHEGREYRLRKTVTRLRLSFEAQELDRIHWIPGKVNVADALTKRTLPLSRLLNRLLAQGFWLQELEGRTTLDSSTWV